jgi:ferric iron reductase protein FhuF
VNAIGLEFIPQNWVPPRALSLRRAHPLTEPLRRVTALDGPARAGLGLTGRPLSSWTLATELTEVPSPRLAHSLRRVGVHFGTADRLVMSSLFFGSYSWQLAAASLGSFLLSGHVPDASAENVAVHIGDDGRVDEVRFLGGGFATVAGSAAAEHPDAVVVPQVDALRELLVRRMTNGHLEELMLALQAEGGLGMRALWAALEDRCISALIWLGKRLDRTDDVVAEASALGRTPPFVGTSTVQHHACGDQHDLTQVRGFCRLRYRLNDRSACTTCPLRRTDADTSAGADCARTRPRP